LNKRIFFRLNSSKHITKFVSLFHPWLSGVLSRRPLCSLCDNPVAPATVETAATIDSKGKAAIAKKFSFLANKLQAAASTGTLSMVTNQETVPDQLNRYISDLTLTETNLNSDNGMIEFWSERMAIFKLIGTRPSVSASITCICGYIFSLLPDDCRTKKLHGNVPSEACISNTEVQVHNGLMAVPV